MALLMRTATGVLNVLWPAFVMAGVLEMMVFAVVDPNDVYWYGTPPLNLSRAGVYTVTFFIFWAIIAVASAVTLAMNRPPEDAP
jgi:heme/copper-type cytochrome/quinol oxidase subunit 1